MCLQSRALSERFGTTRPLANIWPRKATRDQEPHKMVLETFLTSRQYVCDYVYRGRLNDGTISCIRHTDGSKGIEEASKSNPGIAIESTRGLPSQLS